MARDQAKNPLWRLKSSLQVIAEDESQPVLANDRLQSLVENAEEFTAILESRASEASKTEDVACRSARELRDAIIRVQDSQTNGKPLERELENLRCAVDKFHVEADKPVETDAWMPTSRAPRDFLESGEQSLKSPNSVRHSINVFYYNLEFLFTITCTITCIMHHEFNLMLSWYRAALYSGSD
jgi:hypothetical protein